MMSPYSSKCVSGSLCTKAYKFIPSESLPDQASAIGPVLAHSTFARSKQDLCWRRFSSKKNAKGWEQIHWPSPRQMHCSDKERFGHDREKRERRCCLADRGLEHRLCLAIRRQWQRRFPHEGLSRGCEALGCLVVHRMIRSHFAHRKENTLFLARHFEWLLRILPPASEKMA